MHRGKLRIIACFVNRHLRFCVVWKTSGHREFRQQTFCVVWKTSGHREFRQQTICVMWKACDFAWSVNRLSVWYGKLSILCDLSTDYLCDVENLFTKYVSETWHLHHRLPCKTYSLNTFPQYDLIFLFTNHLLSSFSFTFINNFNIFFYYYIIISSIFQKKTED